MSAITAIEAPAERIVAELASSKTESFRQQMGHVSRHSSIFFAGTIFTAATAYVFKVYLARTLGAEALGIYALGMTVLGFMSLFSSLGLPQSAVRFVARYCATGDIELLRGFLGRSLVLLFASNLVFGGGLLLLGPWVSTRFYHTPKLIPYLGFFTAIMFVGALTTFFGQVLAGYKDVARRTLIINFIGSPLTMVLTAVFLTLGLGLRGYLIGQIASANVVLFLLFWMAWKLTPPDARPISSGLRPLDKDVISFSAAAFGVSFLEFQMSQTDKILIGFYGNTRELGIYTVAVSLVAFVPVVLQSVNQIFSPTIANLHARGDLELLGRMFQSLTKWILGLTLPLAAVLVVFAAPLMRVFGPEFERGWPILLVGTIGQLINCGVGSVGYLLLMSGYQNCLVRIQIAMAVVVVMLNLLLIPEWGIMGAAVAVAITNALMNLWCLMEVKRKLGLFPYNRGYLALGPPFALTVVLLLLLRAGLALIGPEWIAIGIGLIVAYASFLVTALAFRLETDDRLIAKAIWSGIFGLTRRAEVNI
jgi:O-antigen/teichoic acid export membrane protein